MRKGPVYLSVTSSANLAALDATNRKLREVSKTSTQTNKGLAGFGKSLGKIAGIGAVVAVGAKAVKEATESFKVTRTTEQILKNTGLAASISSQQIGDLAMQISNLTGIDDEQVQAASNVLLGFKDIVPAGKDAQATLANLTQVATDLGARLGKDPAAAAKLLGKALADPAKGISALYRAGLPLDKQTSDRVKALAKAGKAEEARALLLQNVASQTKGMAAAVADPMTRLQTLFNNLLEVIGMPILDALTPILASLQPVMKTLTPILQILGKWIGHLVTRLADGLQPIIPVVMRLLEELAPVFMQVVDAVVALLPLVVVLTPVIVTLVQMLAKALPGAISFTVNAIRALVIMVSQWFNLLELTTRVGPLSKFHDTFKGAADAAKMVVDELDRVAKTDYSAFAADALKTTAIDYQGAADALASGAKSAQTAAGAISKATGGKKVKPKTATSAKAKTMGDQSFTVAGSGGGLSLSVTVNGSVVQERDIARTIRDELLQFARRQGANPAFGV